MKKKTIIRTYRVELVDYGLYASGDRGDCIHDSKTLNGTWHELNDERLLDEIDLISVVVGSMFGIRYKVHGPIPEQPLKIDNEVAFPPRYNDSFKRIVDSSSFTCENIEGSIIPSLFSIDEDADLISGVYRFSVRLEGVELLHKSLQINVAEQVAASDC